MDARREDVLFNPENSSIYNVSVRQSIGPISFSFFLGRKEEEEDDEDLLVTDGHRTGASCCHASTRLENMYSNENIRRKRNNTRAAPGNKT